MACADEGEQIQWEALSQDDINGGVLGVVLGVVVVTVVGTAFDVFVARRRQSKAQDEDGDNQQQERTQRWSAFLLCASYALLVPGLMLSIFGFGITISVFGVDKTVAGETDTTLGVIRSLWNRGAQWGAGLIFFYAFVVPVAKLVLLIAGHMCMRSACPRKTVWARRCIRIVQELSKWASPDVFAYILLTYLIRMMNHPPTLVTDAQLDVGFTCFALFCVGSTLSSLWIRLPNKEASSTQGRFELSSTRWMRAKLRLHGLFECKLGGRPAFKVANLMWVALVILFSASFVNGLVQSVLVLQLDLDVLYERNPCLVPWAPVIDGLNLPALMHSEAKVMEVTKKLYEWGSAGDFSSWVAFAMVVLFAITFPIFDMVFLTGSYIQLRRGSHASSPKTSLNRKRHQVLGKLSMLDVLVVGCVVIALALTSMREQGLIVSLGSGWLHLAVAVLSNYAAYGLLSFTLMGQRANEAPIAEPTTAVDECPAPAVQV